MALPLGSGSKPKPPAPKGLLPGLAHTVSGIGTTVAHVTHAPPPPSLASTLSRAPSIASSSVHQAVHAATTPHKAVVPRGDVQSSGSRYPGTNKGQDVTAYKKSAAYKAAVAETFLHQSLPQQGAILRGIMSVPNAYKTVEGSTIFKAWRSLSIDHATALQRYLPHTRGLGDILGPALHGLEGVIAGSTGDLRSPYGGTGLAAVSQAQGRIVGSVPSVPLLGPGLKSLEKLYVGNTNNLRSPFGGEGQAAVSQAVGNLNAGIQSLPTVKPLNQETQLSAAGLPPQQIVKNFLKDAVDLPAEAGPSIAIPVTEALNNHWSQALHTALDPYVNAFEHPTQAAQEHPGLTALMFGGLLHPTARAIDTAQSLARTRHLPDVRAESIHLTGKLTHERPDYSKSPITRASQKSIANQLYERNAEGQLVPKSDTTRARLTKLETSRIVGQNERVRRAGHTEEMHAHATAVLQSRPARAAHEAKTFLQYDPEAPLIHGADVLALITQGVIRRPQTFVADLTKHIAEVSATRHELIDFPASLKQHDAYVAALTKVRDAAAKNKNLVKDLAPAFRAAERYVKEYAPHERAAHALGHFREMTKEALQRRTLMAAVATHMPGARFDPELGMVRDVPMANGGIRTEKLTTDQMRAFVRKETGGRDVAFVSHEASRGDRAHYVSGQRRPYPAAVGNTLYNFRHGLTNASHEAMLEQRVRMRGIVDSHRAVNRLDDQLVDLPRKGEGWKTYKDAARDLEGTDMVPIRLAQQFHPPASLKKALDNVNMGTLEEEAARRSLDINARLAPSDEPGRYGAINAHAAEQLKRHEDLISPGPVFRAMRGITNQFRTVALATSFRHLPGVFQEQLIRAAAEGIGPISWLAGRAVVKRMRELDPVLGRQRHIEATGGAVTGQALALRTRQVARHFEGTMLAPPLRAFEKALRAPVLRQATSLWHAWTKFTLQGTKKYLEENAAVAAIGKQTIADFGGRHGLLAKTMGTWGQMVDQAAHGMLDEATARRMGSYIRRVYGRWTDLTPGEQQILMFSPFGMWWTNSVAWLARMPIDHPVGTAFFAALNAGTQQEREKLGLDMFSPNHLPLYKQGGIPIGGQLWGANYYSPGGVINDPGQTAASLLVPWQAELWHAVQGEDWKGDPITSPSNPAGRNKASPLDILTVILNSGASSFIPLYQKAQTIVEGGASSYATSTFPSPKTKGPNPGLLSGLKKAVMPIRLGSASAGGKPSSSGGSGPSNGWGASGSSSSSNGWGGGSSSAPAGNGWGG